MKEILSHHSNEVDSFTLYLTNLNKTFASSSTAGLRVYFSPVVIQRFTGIVHYFNQAVNTFHIIPDILNVNTDNASDNYRHYRTFRVREKSDDTLDIDVPLLTGATNWINFRDKFHETRSTDRIPFHPTFLCVR